MNRDFPLRIATLFLLGLAFPSYAQTQRASNATPDDPSKAEVVYTGRFMGYFRVPSLQHFNAASGCPDLSPYDSQAAIEFLAKRNTLYQKAILVGTGDNFAPQLEARTLENPPPPQSAVGNKELYVSDQGKWVFYTNVKDGSPLDQTMKAGLGTIHTDNVGCFVRAAGYDGIVPGRHDFYFGPERVRQLARFLASDTDRFKPVQMLGANMVLKTFPVDDKPIPATLKEKPWFAVKLYDDYPVQNLSDGDSVYPWFSYVKIQIGKLPANDKPRELLVAAFQKRRNITKADVVAMIDSVKIAFPGDPDLPKLFNDAQNFPEKPIYICASDGNPNQIPRYSTKCDPPMEFKEGEVRLVGDSIVYVYTLKQLGTTNQPHPNVTLPKPIGEGKLIEGTDKRHFSTLVAGRNYGLCKINQTDQTNRIISANCIRFSVHFPFFYFPHYIPQRNTEGTTNYIDPDPYVLLGDRAAIFGVVDPDLGSHVGILNFGWKNLGDGLISKVSVEDPVEALREQLDYFERQHGRDFKGLKILLAQMSPQQAKALAAKFPEFQMVISDADMGQSTSQIDMNITWKPNLTSAAFIGVPAPYFDPKTRKEAVRFGVVEAEKKEDKNQEVESWKLASNPSEPMPIADYDDPATNFWKAVTSLPGCVTEDQTQKLKHLDTNQEYLKLLVLCTMRERLNADVALIQTRDLFEKIPLPTDVTTAPGKSVKRSLGPGTSYTTPNVQQILDRLIWKGDLLTLMYVPGSALKAALATSDKFASDENASLSLVVDRGRTLETLGIDKNEAGEYIVNELPIDDKKLYAVATTDFISAGDTGYPELAKAALNTRTHPAAFPAQLISISSLVCRKLKSQIPTADCLDPIDRESYLDKTLAAQIEPQRQPSRFRRFWDAVPFKTPAKDSSPTTIGDAVKANVQRRGTWILSLKDFSFGFDTLVNNFTDEEIGKKFGGNPTSGVQATYSKTFHFDSDLRLVHSSHRRDYYIEPGANYKRITTGDTPNKFKISQDSNRFFIDSGVVLWRIPGRPIPNFGLNLSLHTETQLQQPYSTFTLGNDAEDLFKIYQPRSWKVFPRLGLRWQNRDNFAEFGFEAGKEFNALLGYEFDTAAGDIPCSANSAITFAKCIGDNSKTTDGITKDSPVRVMTQDRPSAGVYWKTNFSIPFGARVKYVLEDEADFLFVDFDKKTSLDTRFLDRSKHTLSFSIFPSVSIGPTLRFLLYQNKVNRDFLVQKEYGIETKISFDIFNRRETGVQVKYKP